MLADNDPSRAAAGVAMACRSPGGRLSAVGLLECTFLIVLSLSLPACDRPKVEKKAPAIATTTSYLEAATTDVAGDEVRIIRLAEPGTCPGHFDIRPSQVQELRQCRVLLRFDFQKSLDGLLTSSETNGPRVAEVAISGGMCQPQTYLTACRQVAEALISVDLLDRTTAQKRLELIGFRLDQLSQQATNQIAQAGLRGAPVIASRHQKEFCQWLGLNVVANFRPADTASVGEIQEAIGAGKVDHVNLVIANLPEGRRTADALAERLKAKTVVFDNFPNVHKGKISFDQMLAANVQRLLGESR